MDLKLFLRCLFSPSLYTIHRGTSSQSGTYDPNEWERWGDNFITSFFLLRWMVFYTSPMLVFLMSRRGYFSISGAESLVKVSLGLGVLVGASYCIRSYGRMKNDKYRTFLLSLDRSTSDSGKQNIKELKNYDFEYTAWPSEFESSVADGEKKPVSTKRSWFSALSPCSLLSYIVLHTFGIRLIYPGSIKFLSFVMTSVLNQGRHRLIVAQNGERFKIRTSDGNFIDTMFIDRRQVPFTLNGNTLVVCSEGNAGFYEIGVMVTPIEAGYSVLGWNHPGFASSTGMPYPDEEQNAIDAVMQFALCKLGFVPENIILFGWSIGGYATSWAAMHYPNVRAVVLDASFDDLLPLAIPRMPPLLEPIVKQVVRLHANLDIARRLVQYPGQVLVVRRTMDEILCLEPNDITTNRGNHLMVAVLKHRYPNLFSNSSQNALNEWIAAVGTDQNQVSTRIGVDNEQCEAIIQSYLAVNDPTYPSELGSGLNENLKAQMLLYYASRYMLDYASTHCTPLPMSHFQIPPTNFY